MPEMKTSLLWNCSGEASTEMNPGNRQKVENYLAQRVGNLICPVHGEAATIVCQGSSLQALSFDVKACCPKMAMLVREKIES